MRYGYCVHPDYVTNESERLAFFTTLAQAGFDYVELPLFTLSSLTQEELTHLKKTLEIIPCKACNVFFPWDMKLVGPNMDMGGIRMYLERMLPLAASLGVENLVFGNGGARKIPDGQSRESIWADLRKIVEEMEIHAKKAGIPISVEPLNTTETNIINSYGEAVALAKGLSYVSAMVDSYHTAANKQTYDDVYETPEALWHIHTAYPTGRMVPSPEDEMALYSDFVQMVKALDYDGKISVEGALRATEPKEVMAELKACTETLKMLFG